MGDFVHEYERAAAAGERDAASGQRAVGARYDARRDRIVIDLRNGARFELPPKLAQGLERASARQLARIEVSPDGYGLHWPALDADLAVPALVAGVFGSRAWMMRTMAAHGGASRSRKKIVAARANGAKGGRPRTRSAA